MATQETKTFYFVRNNVSGYPEYRLPHDVLEAMRQQSYDEGNSRKRIVTQYTVFPKPLPDGSVAWEHYQCGALNVGRDFVKEIPADVTLVK